MEAFDWKARVVLSKLSEGSTFTEAAAAAALSRRGLFKRRVRCPEFAEAVKQARQQGLEEREYRLWLKHPFRGLRPPTGKGHGGKPRFRHGR